jgi:hypothetical protein
LRIAAVIPALFMIWVLAVALDPFLGGGGEDKEKTAPLDMACIESFNASGPRLPGPGDFVSVERRDGRCVVVVVPGPGYVLEDSGWVAEELETKYFANAFYGTDGRLRPRPR